VPHSIPKILDRLKIRPDHHHGVEQPTLPTSGTLIPIEDHHLLKDDFEEFETGEYVGFEIDDDESGGLFHNRGLIHMYSYEDDSIACKI